MPSFVRKSPWTYHLLHILFTAAISTALATEERRDLLGSILPGLGSDATNAVAVANALINGIEATVPLTTLTSPEQALSTLARIFNTTTNFLDTIPALIAASFDPRDIEKIVEGFSPALNSFNNRNPAPPKTIYPIAAPGDAPYTVSEAALRSAIYIPSTFTYGAKPPVLLFPGTGIPGGSMFSYNYGTQLAKLPNADPLWVNVPGISLGDAQVTAEYAAYAINYIAAITRRNVTVVSHSQGSLNVQWALKYWPSTRSVITDYVALSPDFHGTVLTILICPASLPILGCTPAILQQKVDSEFVQTLLANGGDSAYVRTTTVRSAIDMVVQPQTGVEPSGVLKDARNVGVKNYLVQTECPIAPAGLLVTHQGIIYNSLAYDLVLDVLDNGGPGEVSRLDLGKTCSRIVAQGQTLEDLVAAEATLVLFYLNFLKYEPRAFVEPPIMSYAA
ncbi:putative lipase [Teratosphaeria destructans]|uniref:Lipase n=1 Tax=Teratosphaeria destructans TaxID=418781 RepID=A0A9W7VZK4_9PEZI|nr:putative lipase [Teratosphaeria destructans]